MTKTWAVVVCVLAVSCISQPTVAEESDYALVNGRLFNGVDNRIIEDATVFVVDGRIERIGSADDAIPAGFTIIDLEQNYLMPGLIDAHTRTFWRSTRRSVRCYPA